MSANAIKQFGLLLVDEKILDAAEKLVKVIMRESAEVETLSSAITENEHAKELLTDKEKAVKYLDALLAIVDCSRKSLPDEKAKQRYDHYRRSVIGHILDGLGLVDPEAEAKEYDAHKAMLTLVGKAVKAGKSYDDCLFALGTAIEEHARKAAELVKA